MEAEDMAVSGPSERRWLQRPRLRVVLVGVAALALLGLFTLVLARKHEPTAAGSQAKAETYTCSMHPSIQSAQPGSCPICGMTLTPVTAEQAASGVIMVDEARQRLGGVRTVAASVAPMSLTISASGRVSYDEFSLTDVSFRVPGYVSALHVQSVGQEVKKGEPLLTLQSAELYAAQQELLASKGNRASRSARDKLILMGMSEAQVDAVVQHGEPSREVELQTPISGYAITKEVVVGARVLSGQRAYRFASTEKVWIEADVDDRDMPELTVGQTAQIALDNSPGRTFEGYVIYVYRYLETSARTGRVRLTVDNPTHTLRPGMSVTVKFQTALGTRLQVPVSAIVYTGARRLVFVSDAAGQFRPQEVQVGRQAAGMIEIVSGLQPGQLVAASGTFMLAAEARITTNTTLFDRKAEEDPPPMAAEPMPQPQAASVQAAHYVCPMHPDVQSDKPSKCPKCGMDLQPAPQRP